MEVKANKGFEEIKPRVESELEKTLEERGKLGLSVPQSCDVFIGFYDSQNVNAQTIFGDYNHMIKINVAPCVSGNLGKDDRNDLKEIMKYFDFVKDMFSVNDEESVFAFIKNPDKTIKEFEYSFSKGDFERHKKFLEERGTMYEEYKEGTKKNAGIVRNTLRNLWPKIIKSFKDSEMSFLRHEIDHVDFFNSPVYFNHVKKSKEVNDLGMKWAIKGDQKSSREYAQANLELLDSMSKIDPLLETRALFFDYVNPGEWGKVNFNEKKQKVRERFISDYVENGFSGSILHKIISPEWSKGRMNRQTSNHLFKTVYRRMNSTKASRYKVEPEEVDYGLANKILYKDLPEKKLEFAENANTSAEVIGDVYRDNPSKFKEARNARSFNEYLEMCKK